MRPDNILITPSRTKKVRETGLTIVMDRGYGIRLLEDLLETAADYVDFVKLGWGTGYLTQNLQRKIEILQSHAIP